MISFALESLGCKVNYFEANASADLLKQAGYQLVDIDNNPDFIIVYTCAVTNVAESKTRKLLRSLKRNHPNSKIVAVGCFIQVCSEELLNELPIDLAIGSNHKKDIVQYIDALFNKNEPMHLIKDILKDAQFQNLGAALSQTHTRANLKIQDGCNQFCAYCIIPYARGRETCLPFDEIIHQTSLLVENHQEIILTGIHTGRYFDQGKKLCDVLDALATQYPNVRFRISSIESSEISDELIDVMKKHANIARHLHIPLQAGCDSQLKLMNRPYTTSQYLSVLNKLRNEFKDIAISCDYIVGFVNESEQDFKDAYHFIQQCHFSFMHVFPYSRKKGTAADAMDNHINESIKKERTQKVLQLASELKADYLYQQIGKIKQILIETVKNNESYGYSSDYCYVHIPQNCAVGSFVDVVIKEVDNDTLKGELICY